MFDCWLLWYVYVYIFVVINVGLIYDKGYLGCSFFKCNIV